MEDGPGVIIRRIGGVSSPIFLCAAGSVIWLDLNLKADAVTNASLRRPETSYIYEYICEYFPATLQKPQPPFCLASRRCASPVAANILQFRQMTVNSCHGRTRGTCWTYSGSGGSRSGRPSHLDFRCWQPAHRIRCEPLPVRVKCVSGTERNAPANGSPASRHQIRFIQVSPVAQRATCWPRRSPAARLTNFSFSSSRSPDCKASSCRDDVSGLACPEALCQIQN